MLDDSDMFEIDTYLMGDSLDDDYVMKTVDVCQFSINEVYGADWTTRKGETVVNTVADRMRNKDHHQILK